MGAVKMSERIKYLKESPCYQCGVAQQCLAKITRCPRLQEISDYVMPRADYDYHDCASNITPLSQEVFPGYVKIY